MTNEELQEKKDLMLPILRELNHDLKEAREAHDRAYRKFNKLNLAYAKIDRTLAEQRVTKVPRGKSGIKKSPVKEASDILKTLSTEQKNTLLESLGLTIPKP